MYQSPAEDSEDKLCLTPFLEVITSEYMACERILHSCIDACPWLRCKI